MLGFYFTSKPTVQLQVDKLCRKANKRTYVLAKYKKYGIGRDKLKVIYTATIRSVVEYSCHTYHTQLNKGQINQLERVQKKSLKIIYGYQHNYKELLELLSLERLEARRIKLIERFTRKTSENLRYIH